MKTRFVLVVALGCAAALAPSAATQQTLLMNRLGPSQMVLYVANPDGSGERPLFGTSGFDYNPDLDDQAAISPDGAHVAFVSTRGSHTANI